MREDTIARVNEAHRLIGLGIPRARAFSRARTAEVTYNAWLKARPQAAAPAPTGSGTQKPAPVAGETVAGRLLRSNLPDADKLALLSEAFR